MLVGNNIALVAFTSLITVPVNALVLNYLGVEHEIWLLLIGTVVITILVLIVGEYVPKTIFRLFADDALYFFAWPLRALQLLLLLPSKLMTGTSNALLGLFIRRPATELEPVLTRLDLENFVNRSQTAEEDTAIDTQLFGNALNLAEVRVRDCMVPRTEVVTIDVSASIDELEVAFRESRLSRLPVVNGDIDEVLGYVHHHQLMSMPQSIRDIILELTFVPEVTRVADLLDRSIKEQLSIACVVDEFGGVSGLVTMEDLLEEIFGEIEDEFDDDEFVEIDEGEGKYRFSGRLEISYLNRKYELGLPEGDYQTLSGFIVTTAERVPEQDESLELEGFHFLMTEVSNTKIETVLLRKLLPPEGE